MASREFLNLVARVVNVDASSYANDSKLEQKLVYELKNNVGDTVQATGTLTLSGNLSADDTVTIGGYTYTMKAVPSAAFEVDLGGTAAATLDNLKAAINDSGTEGTTYGTGTYAHPDVTATTNTDTTQVVEARLGGTTGNSIATTETGSNSAWGAATLENGANGTYYKGQDAGDNAALSGDANV